jgi:Spy/CpxP family protein refolding chaperone
MLKIKRLAVALTAILTVSSLGVSTASAADLDAIAADVNHDGTVDNADVVLLNKYIVGSATIN